MWLRDGNPAIWVLNFQVKPIKTCEILTRTCGDSIRTFGDLNKTYKLSLCYMLLEGPLFGRLKQQPHYHI
jgi:hypothetical protein